MIPHHPQLLKIKLIEFSYVINIIVIMCLCFIERLLFSVHNSNKYSIDHTQYAIIDTLQQGLFILAPNFFCTRPPGLDRIFKLYYINRYRSVFSIRKLQIGRSRGFTHSIKLSTQSGHHDLLSLGITNKSVVSEIQLFIFIYFYTICLICLR